MATAAKREPAPVQYDTLAAAMAAAFAEFEGASKGKVNPAFKSKYADLASVMDAIKPALVTHGLFFTQAMHDASGGVCVETVIHHASGESYSCGKLFVPASKQDAQGFGSALTYARRYSLMTAFGIPAEDDDGNAAARSAPANDRNGGNRLREQLQESVKQTGKDAPFPQGPAKNKTELKTIGRDFWRQVEGCGDEDELTALLTSHKELQAQIAAALPEWWTGGTRPGGEQFEGLGAVIARKQTELAATGDWKNNPLNGG